MLDINLKELGFNVFYGENLSVRDMDKKLRSFSSKLKNGGVGLFFFAFSKEKFEDEMHYFIRMRSMALTLLFVIITGILSPILYLAFNETPTIRETQGFATTVILQYIATFYIQKMMK